MLEEINEPVEVLAVFKKDMVYPNLIRWNNKVYKIKKLNMVHHVLNGDAMIHYFSVSDNFNFFKLAFNSKNLKWTLEQLYNEG